MRDGFRHGVSDTFQSRFLNFVSCAPGGSPLPLPKSPLLCDLHRLGSNPAWPSQLDVIGALLQAQNLIEITRVFITPEGLAFSYVHVRDLSPAFH